MSIAKQFATALLFGLTLITLIATSREPTACEKTHPETTSRFLITSNCTSDPIEVEATMGADSCEVHLLLPDAGIVTGISSSTTVLTTGFWQFEVSLDGGLSSTPENPDQSTWCTVSGPSNGALPFACHDVCTGQLTALD